MALRLTTETLVLAIRGLPPVVGSPRLNAYYWVDSRFQTRMLYPHLSLTPSGLPRPPWAHARFAFSLRGQPLEWRTVLADGMEVSAPQLACAMDLLPNPALAMRDEYEVCLQSAPAPAGLPEDWEPDVKTVPREPSIKFHIERFFLQGLPSVVRRWTLDVKGL